MAENTPGVRFAPGCCGGAEQQWRHLSDAADDGRMAMEKAKHTVEQTKLWGKATANEISYTNAATERRLRTLGESLQY